jgi:polyisoprenoid-binding protein YceI
MNIRSKGLIYMLLASAMVLAGSLATFCVADAAIAAASTSNQTSKVTIEGTATIYGNWSCTGLADVKAVPGDSLSPVPGFPGGVKTTTVTVSVRGIECGDGTMNKHLQKALKEKEFPEVRFQTEQYHLDGNGIEVKAAGDLTIAGVKKPVELAAKLTPLAQGGVQVVGKVDIRMLDYNVKPPSLLFGTLKVANEVSVKFDTAIKPAETQQASASLQAQ